MATAKSTHKISGRIGDLVYYVRNGKQCVRQAGGLDQKRLQLDPSFANSRKANAEFGAAAKVGAAFRKSLGGWGKTFGSGALPNRVFSIVRKVLTVQQGEAGQRPVSLATQPSAFHHFPLNQKAILASQFDQLPLFRSTPQGLHLSLTLQTAYRPRLPKTATAFRWVLITFSFPDFVFDSKVKTWVPVRPLAPANEMVSPWLSIHSGKGLPETFLLPHLSPNAEEARILGIGIQFAEVVGEDAYVFSAHSAMELVRLEHWVKAPALKTPASVSTKSSKSKSKKQLPA